MPPDSSKSSESELDAPLNRARGRVKEPKYVCSEVGCQARFKRLDALDLHVFKHNGIKKHACMHDDCDKSYRTFTHLKRHIRSTHERVEPAQKTVSCIISSCQKLFTNASNMQRHVREVHENHKSYKCHFCELEFTQKLKLKRHEIKQHTGIYPYTCAKCNKGLQFEFQYERHVASCQLYKCTDCSQVFEKWTLFRKHCKETKHGKVYYQCEHCPKTYAKPSDLKRHVGAQHASGEHESAYKCPHEGCQRAYAYERNLRQHVLTTHEGKRYACDVVQCGKIFKNAHNLAKHKKCGHDPNKQTVLSKKQTTGKRKKRKDAGRAKISNLAKMSDLVVDSKLDELLRERNEEALAVAADILISQETDVQSDMQNLLDLAVNDI